MDSKRQGQLFRAFVKKMIRDKGLRFDKSVGREIGREISEINEAMPELELGASEVLTIYLEIMRELVTEHFASVESLIGHEKDKEGGRYW